MDVAQVREILGNHRAACVAARDQAQQLYYANMGAISAIDQVLAAMVKAEQEEFQAGAAGAVPSAAPGAPSE